MHHCPAKGCDMKIGAHFVACRRHWFSLPAELRYRIWTLYRQERGSSAHREAVFSAIAILSERTPGVRP